MKKSTLVSVAGLFLCGAIVAAQEHTASVIAANPQWDRVKSLVGEWEGYAMEGGQKMATKISIRMTGDGSAVMHWMDAGTPHEMITMFHMDKSELLATHYCSAHNQPRLRATAAGKPGEVAFEFKDGTNIRPGDGYMKQIVIAFVDADHHNETWGYDNKGTLQSHTLYLTRAKR
jgi:YD repeat-containing protein